MAVYTEPTDEELATLLQGWGLDGLRNFKGIAEGVQNSNFSVEAAQGRFIMTIYERSVALEDLPFYLGAVSLMVSHPNAHPPAKRARWAPHWPSCIRR